ncbi:MAG: HD domain-containing protein [Spirochaetes bacterium]|nr:HD domain-containing protein [Spirochaetota bacterium]
MRKEIILNTEMFVKERMAKVSPSHGWDHVQRVVALALKIARKERADLFIVKMAALLHDIARSEEDASRGKICHAKRGAQIAEKFLSNMGISQGEIKNIAHCIAAHRFRGKIKPKTKEAKVVFDADKLDSIGAVGIGRAFLFAGEVGARLFNGEVEIHKTKAYSHEDTAYREYMVKLRYVKHFLLTKEGRRIASGRHQFMKKYFQQIKDEVLCKK